MSSLDALSARHLTARFHAITHAVKDSAVEHLNVRPENVTVVYRSRDATRLGVRDAHRRRIAREMLGLRTEPMILAVGRQTQQKGHEYLVDAIARVVKTHPDAVCVIAGMAGRSTPVVQARIREHRLDGHVRLLGHRQDVGDLLVAADVFAFPSIYEGLGAALIEAMALETPIVASDLPAIREVTDDGRAASLVRSGDTEALAAALARLLDDHGLARELAARGRARYVGYFTPQQSTNGLMELYADVLGG